MSHDPGSHARPKSARFLIDAEAYGADLSVRARNYVCSADWAGRDRPPYLAPASLAMATSLEAMSSVIMKPFEPLNSKGLAPVR